MRFVFARIISFRTLAGFAGQPVEARRSVPLCLCGSVAFFRRAERARLSPRLWNANCDSVIPLR